MVVVVVVVKYTAMNSWTRFSSCSCLCVCVYFIFLFSLYLGNNSTYISKYLYTPAQCIYKYSIGHNNTNKICVFSSTWTHCYFLFCFNFICVCVSVHFWKHFWKHKNILSDTFKNVLVQERKRNKFRKINRSKITTLITD